MGGSPLPIAVTKRQLILVDWDSLWYHPGDATTRLVFLVSHNPRTVTAPLNQGVALPK